MKTWLNIILNWVTENHRSIAITINLLKEDLQNDIVKTEDEETTEPANPPILASLKTENKVVIWSECSTPRLPRAKVNKKYVDIFEAKDLVVTCHAPRRKEYVDAKDVIQKKGGKVFLCVHPWYSPWKELTVEESAELVREYASAYDGVVIDLEGVYLKKIDDTIKSFAGISNLWVAPKMDSKYLTGYYDKIKDWQVNYLWWNYALTLKQWNAYFDKYKFPATSKHNLLLSFYKYLKFVPLEEISNIIKSSPLRIGSFNPKTKDKINLNFLKEYLEIEK